MKVFILPPNSLILANLVEKFGHEPLTVMSKIEKKVKNPQIDSPPLNVTEIEPEKGLKYASSEVPSGVRGRMAMIGDLIEQAEAAIIVDNPDYAFGCVGCDRTNELIKYNIINRDIPLLKIKYPSNEGEGRKMVNRIKNFLEGLDD